MTILKKIWNNLFPFKENPDNRKLELGYSDPRLPIYGFYHIYCANNWRQIFEEQIDRLISSRLADKTEYLYLYAIGTESDIEYIKGSLNNRISDCKIEIERGSDPKRYEYPTLLKLYQKSQTDDFYCYYFHTKGSSNSAETLHWYKGRGVKSLRQLQKNSRAWRRMMEYWNFDRYRLAISVLNQGYNAYGCYLKTIEGEGSYYGGNFWWSKSDFIKYRDVATLLDKKSRYEAELWLLNNNDFYYNAFEIYPSLTITEIPEGVYHWSSFLLHLSDTLRFNFRIIISNVKKFANSSHS